MLNVLVTRKVLGTDGGGVTWYVDGLRKSLASIVCNNWVPGPQPDCEEVGRGGLGHTLAKHIDVRFGN